MNIVDDRINPTLLKLLKATVGAEASDLHLIPGYRATYRIHGRLSGAAGEVLDRGTTRAMVESILPEPALHRVDELKNMDFSVSLRNGGQAIRFRVNVFFSQGDLCACFRYIPNDIPSFDWMSFPKELAHRMVHLTNGLVIITGITGSGKTTTLAALIEMLNTEGGYRIITVEEPIEYVFARRETTVITQREVGTDVASFYDGLKYGLRQDPDVVLVGEIRDRETAQMALSAAETGHLILTTLHTMDAKGAVTRLVDLFPSDSQDDIRTQLSLSLRYVVAQHLLPNRVEGQKRALALEVMTTNHPIRAAIRDGKIASLESAIQTGKKDGMFPLDNSLEDLVASGQITYETAIRYAKDPQNIHVTRPTH
ncbi:MAG TPA: PilT/PilU family type 4a pilus ATPase [Phycisphaerae bacterium]|nr:PilT/PilU family type 4a pilus ATPase [Phycisphaerae bacterium]